MNGLKSGANAADPESMRSMTGLGALVGTTIGGIVPMLWGASGFSLVSVVFSAVGGVAGVWLAVRIADA